MIRYAIAVLLFAGTAFGQAPRPPVDKLSQLRDVTITSPTLNQILKFDGSKWINSTGGGGGATTFIELSDVPQSYSGAALRGVRVNAAANGLEFFSTPTPTATFTPTPTATATATFTPTPSATATATATPTPTSTAAAPADAHYVTTQAESGLTNEFNLGALGNGFLKQTVTTGVSTITIDSSTYLTANQTITLTGDVTGSGATAITTTLANIPTAVSAAGSIVFTDIAAPSSPSAAHLAIFGDSTDLRFHDKNAAGTIGTTVVSDTGSSNNFLTAISASGVISKAQPSYSNLSGTDAPAIANVTGLGTGVVTFLATPSSANLRSALTDENGTGAALFDGATSPTFVTPILGTPTSGTLTNCTGTANGLTAGDVTRNHAIYSSASPPTVDVGMFTVAKTGVDLKSAGTTAGFVVPSGRTFLCQLVHVAVTAVTSGGAGVCTLQLKESGASAAMTPNISSGSSTPDTSTVYTFNNVAATIVKTCAAGNTVNIVITAGEAGSTAVTGTVFITGFYTQ